MPGVAEDAEKVCKYCGEPAHEVFEDLCEVYAGYEEDRYVCSFCSRAEGRYHILDASYCERCFVEENNAALEDWIGMKLDPSQVYRVVTVKRSDSIDYYVVPPGQDPKVTSRLMSRLQDAYLVTDDLAYAIVESCKLTGHDLLEIFTYQDADVPCGVQENFSGVFTPETVDSEIADLELELNQA